jgi:hypothetical protein
MSGPVLAILVTVGVHILGAWALIWAMGIDDLRTFFTTDPGDGGDGGSPPEPAPQRPRSGGGVPLPDAVPARIRLRDEQIRLGDLRPDRPRRPDHVPERHPAPARERDAR